VYNRIRLLRHRGHHVLVCGVEGSEPAASAPSLTLPPVRWSSDHDASDSTYPPGYLEAAEDALHDAMDWVAAHSDAVDLVDNHSLHPVPLQRAGEWGVPMITTLHTPPLPPMLAAIGSTASRLVAVSEHTAREWRGAGARDVTVQHNMVDTATWRLGSGGRDLAWFGRIVPEKAPHLAIAAARRAGTALTLVGRIGDIGYFEDVVRPLLGARISYAGEMRAHDVARLVGSSAAVLVTPDWDEPFGLVVAEALATGTPVAAFARGGVPEVIGDNPGARLVASGDVDALARGAVSLLESTSSAMRRATRADAVRRFSFRRHVSELEELMRSTVVRSVSTARQDLLA
jgi:glycosyltransferase involved in cell wall biosynthesis